MGPTDGLALLAIVVTLGIAIVGWSKLKATDRHATEALRLAEAADARAERLERERLERRDVTWTEVSWHDGHRKGLSFRNSGTDAAHDVELIVDPVDGDWPRRWERFSRIDAAERIGIDLTQQHIEHMIDREQKRLTAPRPQLVDVRIAWRSQLGMPNSQTFSRVQL